MSNNPTDASSSSAKYQRQTMLFSRFASPELNQVFRKLLPVRGKVKIKQAIDSNGGGTVCNVISKVPQVFYRVDDCASPLEVDDARFKFFVEKVGSQLAANPVLLRLLRICARLERRERYCIFPATLTWSVLRAISSSTSMHTRPFPSIRRPKTYHGRVWHFSRAMCRCC